MHSSIAIEEGAPVLRQTTWPTHALVCRELLRSILRTNSRISFELDGSTKEESTKNIHDLLYVTRYESCNRVRVIDVIYTRGSRQLSNYASLNCFRPNNLLFTWDPEKCFQLLCASVLARQSNFRIWPSKERFLNFHRPKFGFSFAPGVRKVSSATIHGRLTRDKGQWEIWKAETSRFVTQIQYNPNVKRSRLEHSQLFLINAKLLSLSLSLCSR